MNLSFNSALPHAAHSIMRLPVARIASSATTSGASSTLASPPSSFTQAIGGVESQPAEIPPAASQPAPDAPVAIKGWAQIA